ncbi:MAG: tail fiber domain-containing protein, partial [Alphaproteobacteria bacterium]|nr:tail fiber domain-containing protein [Alphaproteobacteria bacterium]
RIALARAATATAGTIMKFSTQADGAGAMSERMRIDQSGNIGIGTTTTNFPLTVSSANYASGNYTATQQLLDSTTMAADVGGGISFGGKYTTAGAGAEWGAITTGKDNATSGDYAAHMAFFTRANGGSTSERMRISSNGNVGIGTTSPQGALQVSHAYESSVPALGSPSAFLNITNANAWGLIAGTLNSGNVYMQAQRVDSTATSYNMLLQPNGGNVGIGTGTPAYKLDIAAIPYSNSQSGGIRLTTPANEWWSSLVMESSASWAPYTNLYVHYGSNTYKVISFDHSAGNVSFGDSSHPELMTLSAVDWGANKNGGLTIQTTGAAWVSGVKLKSNAGNTPRLALEINGTEALSLLNGGNVGIGTTSPGTKLSVSAGLNQGISVLDSTDSDNARVQLRTSATNGNGIIDVSDNTETVKVELHSNGASYFNAGNVGIGTTSPATALDVVGEINSVKNDDWFNISASEYANAKNAAIRLMRARGTSAAPTQLLSGDIIGSLTYRSTFNPLNGAAVISSATENQGTGAFGSNLQFQTVANGTTSGATRMTIDQNGNVGIGTTTPSYLLQANSSTVGSPGVMAVSSATSASNQSVGQLSFYNTGVSTEVGRISVSRTGSNYAGVMHFYTYPDAGSLTESMTILGSGNVGIGTASPVYTLSVAGVIQGQAVAASGDVLRVGNDSKLVDIDIANTMGVYGVQNSAIGNIKLGSGGGTIYGYSGNIGIGTSTPAQALEVNGSVLAAAYLYSSDARLKTDVAALPGQLDRLSALRPVSFKYTADQKGETHLGLIAQEAETVYPELVKTDDKGMKAIDYPGLIAPLISAVQELRAQNAQLRAELDALKSAQQK